MLQRLSEFIKGGKFLQHLSDYQLFKRDSNLWIWEVGLRCDIEHFAKIMYNFKNYFGCFCQPEPSKAFLPIYGFPNSPFPPERNSKIPIIPVSFLKILFFHALFSYVVLSSPSMLSSRYPANFQFRSYIFLSFPHSSLTSS